MNLGAPELLVLGVVVALIALPFWGLIRAILDKRTGWAIAILVGGLIPPIGLILALVYLLGVRRRMDATVSAIPLAGSGWQADPSGQHQYRYWDGVSWTSQVSDDGVVSTSPLTPGPPPPPPT